MKTIFPFAILLFLFACSSDKNKDQEDQPAEPAKPKPSALIKLDDAHSLMKNGADSKPYLITDIDSFVIDITGYKFILPSPAFDYIDIDYPQMIGGSWGYISLLKNDSTLVDVIPFEKSIDGNKFTVTELKTMGNIPQEFTLAFRFYIDNDKGEQEIDHFGVKVVKE